MREVQLYLLGIKGGNAFDVQSVPPRPPLIAVTLKMLRPRERLGLSGCVLTRGL